MLCRLGDFRLRGKGAFVDMHLGVCVMCGPVCVVRGVHVLARACVLLCACMRVCVYACVRVRACMRLCVVSAVHVYLRVLACVDACVYVRAWDL